MLIDVRMLGRFVALSMAYAVLLVGAGQALGSERVLKHCKVRYVDCTRACGVENRMINCPKMCKDRLANCKKTGKFPR